MQSARLNTLNLFSHNKEINGQNRPITVAWGPRLQRGPGPHEYWWGCRGITAAFPQVPRALLPIWLTPSLEGKQLHFAAYFSLWNNVPTSNSRSWRFIWLFSTAPGVCQVDECAQVITVFSCLLSSVFASLSPCCDTCVTLPSLSSIFCV